MIEISENWKKSHPGSAVAFLSMEVDRPPGQLADLEQRKAVLEMQLREQYQGLSRAELRSQPVIDAYTQYYKPFKKTYHLLLQLDSICYQNKSIPRADPLVQSMFMAELENLLLTAGHDLDQIQGQIKLDSASGDEVYTMLNRQTATCKPGDMVTADTQGVFCSIVYGQDFRTQINAETSKVLYVVYVPPGIESELIDIHLQHLENYTGIAFPQVQITYREIFFA